MTRVQAEFSRPSHNRLPRESCQPLNFGNGRLETANLRRMQKRGVERLRPCKGAGTVVWVDSPLPQPVQTPPNHRGPQSWTQSQDFGDRVAFTDAPLPDSREQHVVHFRSPE